MPPRNGDHIVVMGELHGKPVAMAYLNIRNFNIDYGVHVIRSCWRKKIGTRILTECFRIAKGRDKKITSCVRILRSIKWTSSDRRNIKFHESKW